MKPAKKMQNPSELLLTRQAVLDVLPASFNVRYVSDMKRAGLKWPPTRNEVFSFLRRNPAPSRIRHQRPSCR